MTPTVRSGRAGILAWCVYDWGQHAFNTVIGTFVFSVYFARAVAPDQVTGTVLWSHALELAGIAIAILSPILGAIADRAGRRKPWLGLFTAITVTVAALLWFVRPDHAWVLPALVLVGIGSVSFDLGGVFYNAMLADLAPPERIGRLSGWGWGLGYAGGLACLVTALFALVRAPHPVFGFSHTDSANIRATSLLVAVWFGVFALPLFLLTPDRPASGLGLAQSVRQGLAALGRTLRRIGGERRLVLVLVATALYRDGLTTLFAFGGLYAAGTFGMSFSEIVTFAIALNVMAALGAAGFAWVDDAIGPVPTILISLVGLIGFGVPILLVTGKPAFWVLALGLGIFVGPCQAAGRSLIARLAPPDLVAETFGLYALSGRAAAFLGPLALGWATSHFASQRAGMATIVLFFAAGLALMLRVRRPVSGHSSP